MQRVLSYLSFKGRSNRQRFWLTTLAIWGIIVVGAVLSMAMASVAPLVALLFLLAQQPEGNFLQPEKSPIHNEKPVGLGYPTKGER